MTTIAEKLTIINNAFKAIKQAIINKGGTTSGNVTTYAQAISNIPSGGSTINNQDKTFTTNGIYTADSGYTGLGTVTVNVSGGESETSINPLEYKKFYNLVDSYDAESLTEAEIIYAKYSSKTASDYVSINAENAIIGVADTGISMRYFTNLESVNFPKLKYIFGTTWWNGSSNYKNSKITSVSYPELLGLYDFSGCLVDYCDNLVSFNAPKLITATYDIIANCPLIEKISLPSFTTFNKAGSSTIGLITGCSALRYLSMPKFNCELVDSYLVNSAALECLILGDYTNIIYYLLASSITYTNFTTYVFNVTKVPNLSDTKYIRYNTTRVPHFASGGDGSIYVPDNLVEDFKVATNWATLAEFIKPMSQFVNTWENE